MMSSAIPARLEFQCGHAALVSLPRVKGESTAQRNERIAREKTAAQSRQCDFCTPAVVLQPTPVALRTAEPVVQSSDVVLRPSATLQPMPPAPSAALAVRRRTPGRPRPNVERSPTPAAPHIVSTPPAAPRVMRRPAAAHVPRESTRGRPHNGRVNGTGRPAVHDRTIARSRFRVSYMVEKIVVAQDVHDALRQVESLGATDVVAITSAS